MSESAELDRGPCPRPVIHPFPEDLWRGVPVTSRSTTPVIAGIPMRSTKVIVNLPNHRDIITAATILQGRLCITPHLPNLLSRRLPSQPVCVTTLPQLTTRQPCPSRRAAPSGGSTDPTCFVFGRRLWSRLSVFSVYRSTKGTLREQYACPASHPP